jgi:hypothetical protein
MFERVGHDASTLRTELISCGERTQAGESQQQAIRVSRGIAHTHGMSRTRKIQLRELAVRVLERVDKYASTVDSELILCSARMRERNITSKRNTSAATAERPPPPA